MNHVSMGSLHLRGPNWSLGLSFSAWSSHQADLEYLELGPCYSNHRHTLPIVDLQQEEHPGPELAFPLRHKHLLVAPPAS
jgi:hypothetical protein